jgi:ATP-dependent helicase/nuclease subunit A
MQADELEVKRQIDGQGDQIRVMTVHGAKGLEAPIVFLPDTAKRANTVKADFLPAGDGLVWKTNAKQSAASVSALSEQVADAQMRERMRLLYVAMTRAEKWLIVGAAGDVGDGSDSWYNVIAEGMARAGWVDDTAHNVPIKRVAHLDWHSGDLTTNPAVQTTKVAKPTFNELPKIVLSKTLAPSDMGGAKILAGDPGGEDKDAALARGRLMHTLLEHLPTVPPSDRAELGQALLVSHPDAMDSDMHLLTDAIALIAAPHLAHVFANNALVEVDVTANLPNDGLRMHGAIDRLIISDKSVLAVDFKTNRLVPDSPDQTPEGLLRQMGAYHTALTQVFPDHKIEVAILWTATATLMTIPENLALGALASVTAP